MTVVDSSSYILENVEFPIFNVDATFVTSISDDEAEIITTNSGSLTAIARKSFGSGEVVYLGYDFFFFDDNAARIISNVLSKSN